MRFLLVLLLAVVTQSAGAVTLRSAFTGYDSCLDIVNAGNQDQLRMTGCGNFTGQFWDITPDAEPGFVRLRTRFTGPAMCLDVNNSGDRSQVHMAQCANVTGQQWRIEQAGQDMVRLWNQFTGDSKCLDIVNDGSGRIQLATCGDYSGQYWSMPNHRRSYVDWRP